MNSCLPRRSLGACLLALMSLPAVAAGLQVDAARTAPPLPGTTVMAGYLTLTNDGERAVTVGGASSPDFARLSLHRSVERDGQARMEPVEALTVDPGGRAVLEPGGLHLMMFEPAPRPSVGDTVSVRLHTDAGDVSTRMSVVERAELMDR